MIDQAFIDNLRAQKITWRQLGYNPLMHRELIGEKVGPYIGPDVISSMIDNGALDTSLMRLISSDKIQSSSLDNSKIKSIFRANTAIVAKVGGDFNSIQPAVDYVNSLGGGSIFIKSGTYIVPATIYIPSNIALIGEDPYTTILDYTISDPGDGGIQFYGSIISINGSIAINNGSSSIVGTSTLATTHGVVAGDIIIINSAIYTINTVTDNTHFTIVETYNGPNATGLPCRIYRPKKNIVIRGLQIKNVATANGIDFIYSQNVEIRNCIIDGNNGGISGNNLFNVNILENICRNQVGNGISISNPFEVICHKNISYNNGDSGIYVGSSLGTITSLIDNICVNNYGQGIFLETASNVTVKGNYCSSNSTDGINLQGSSNNNIVSNTCYKNGVDGIKLMGLVSVDSDNNVVLGNQSTHNTDDGIELTSDTNDNLVSHNMVRNNSGTNLVDSGLGNNTADNF